MVAATASEVFTVVLAIAGTLGVGGLIGAMLQRDYERKERMRERMIDVADGFLREVIECSRSYRQAYNHIGTPQAKTTLAAAIESLAQAMISQARLILLFPSADPLKDSPIVTAATAVLDAIGPVSEAIRNNANQSDFNKASGALSAAQGEYARAVTAVIWSRKIGPRRRWRVFHQ